MGKINRGATGDRPVIFGRTVKHERQYIPTAWAKVNFDDDTDTAEGSFTNGTLTCVQSGVYDISVGLVMVNASIQRAYFSATVRKNGIESLKISERYFDPSEVLSESSAGPLRIRTGDILEVWAITNADAASGGLFISGVGGVDITTFSIVRIGE